MHRRRIDQWFTKAIVTLDIIVTKEFGLNL